MLSKLTSLRFKIMLPVAVISVLFLLIAALLNLRSTKTFVQDQLIVRANLLASTTQFVVESSHNQIELQRFISSLQGELGVKEIAILAGNPLKITAASKHQWIGESVEVLPPEYQRLIREGHLQEHFIELKDSAYGTVLYLLPVKNSTQKDGHILVEVSAAEEMALILNLLYRQIFVRLVCVLGIILFTYWMIKKHILRPINLIQESMSKRASGDTTSYVGYKSNDELGQLSQHTNDLFDANEKQKKIIADQQETIAMSAKVVALAQISGSIAHEINNPLFVINGTLYKMEKQLNKEGMECQVMKDGIEQIQEMTDHIAKIIKGLKNLAQTDTGIGLQRVKIKDVVTETLRLYDSHLKRLGVELRLINITEEAEIYWQPVQLQQVLLNLVSNALDAIVELEERWIEISLEDCADLWQLTITDSGHGINEELQKKMFHPFVTTKTMGLGTGLGLAIALQIARYHQGELFFNPTHPHTQFVLKLKKYAA